jgi:rod shape-determining protein MreC
VVGELYGPVQAGVDTLLEPFVDGPRWLRTQRDLTADVQSLEDENAALRSELASVDYDRNRLQEYDGLTRAAEQIGYALVPSRVVGIGPAQSFSRTVTIDAGSRSGVRPDLTVVNADGLVGRVIRVTSGTATVLLAVDADSTVGGRVGTSMKLGFVHGRGDLDEGARLDLELVDQTTVPARGDTVVTWGSDRGAPYVSGVPIGVVRAVYSSLRETTQRAEIEPYVDYAALDLVGVVVPSGTESDRAVAEADGSWE